MFHFMIDAMTDRLIDFAFKLRDGELEEVANWLEKLGATDVIRDEGQVTLTGPSGVRVGLTKSDPNTCGVMLGFAIAGAFWPQAFPGLQASINKRWREEVKHAKSKA